MICVYFILSWRFHQPTSSKTSDRADAYDRDELCGHRLQESNKGIWPCNANRNEHEGKNTCRPAQRTISRKKRKKKRKKKERGKQHGSKKKHIQQSQIDSQQLLQQTKQISNQRRGQQPQRGRNSRSATASFITCSNYYSKQSRHPTNVGGSNHKMGSLE